MSLYASPNFPAIFTENFQQLREFDRDLITALGGWDQIFKAILDKGLSFEDNADVAFVSYTTNAAPNTQDTVAHTLGKVPTRYIVVSKDKAADVYNGGTAFTKTNLYLKCTVASAALTLMIF